MRYYNFGRRVTFSMRTPFSSFGLRFATLLLATFSAGPLLRAQATSAIQGRVTDPSGAIVAGASIAVTNAATGVSRTAHATDDGHYRVPDLLPGTYDIRAEQAGFKTLIKRGIDLQGEAVLNVDFSL